MCPPSDPGIAYGEDALVARLAAGDERARRELIEHNHAGMLRLARAMLGDADAAREVVQDVWVAVFSGIDRFEQRSSLRTWMFRILLNRAQSARARRSREPLLDAQAELAAEDRAVEPSRFTAFKTWRRPPRAWAEGSDPEKLLAQKQVREIMERELEHLPPAQRTVFLLCDVEQWLVPDVCELLEVTPANQRILLHRARAKLRAAVERELEREMTP